MYFRKLTFNFSRTVVRDLLVMVTDGIVTTYERAIKNRGGKKSSNQFSQHEVLQELFNFKFVQLIIPRREDDEVSGFDLKFISHGKSNVNKIVCIIFHVCSLTKTTKNIMERLK